MNDKRTVIVIIPAFNEAGKIGTTVRSIPGDVCDEILVIDDGSTDRTVSEAGDAGATVISNSVTKGVGAVIRRGFLYAAERGFGIAVVMAGNSKDDGAQIPRLTSPIFSGKADFVQGSRFLPGGVFGRMPLHRVVATRFIHPVLFSLASGKRITDSTNGFSAISRAVFCDPGIDLAQAWLDGYCLEPYIFFKAIKLGYRVTEVGVSKIYPDARLGITKMRPIIDWWNILKPIFLLGLGLKK